MILCKGLRLLCGLGILSAVAHAQCYDLTSVHLYDLKGRFQERWDKPIWHAKPGERNFHLDESPWMGGIMEFVIFAIGQVQKTESGWVPLRKSSVPEIWCEYTTKRNSFMFCYFVPYQTAPSTAFRATPIEYDRQVWSLNRDGVLHYSRRTYGNSVVDNTHDFGSTFEAVLDLNTGDYSAVAHGHSNGHYTKRIPAGVELWRDTSLSAKAKLIPQPCTPAMQQVALVSNRTTVEEEARPLPICAVRLRTHTDGESSIEFIMNPRNVASPEGCVVVHEQAAEHR
jgi:hypothetical protein